MDSYMFALREIPLRKKTAGDQVAAFLARHGLKPDPLLEGYYGIFRDDVLCAGAGYYGNIIKCVAVDPDYRGEGLLDTLVSYIATLLHARGVHSLHVFTKLENIKIFESLGFSVIAATGKVALLINNDQEFRSFLDKLALRKRPGLNGALVMNCNPFTLGHRYLVETAAGKCDHIFLFVVEEDASSFPFSVRMRLVEEGTADIPNVTVLPGGPYIISSATFPSYFIKEASAVAEACAELDAVMFGRHIAPAIGVTARFVGEEPNCALTALYNQALQKTLPSSGVRVEVVERARYGGEAISASRVRAFLAKGDFASAREMVPDGTYRYLASEEAKPVLERLAEQQ